MEWEESGGTDEKENGKEMRERYDGMDRQGMGT